MCLSEYYMFNIIWMYMSYVWQKTLFRRRECIFMRPFHELWEHRCFVSDKHKNKSENNRFPSRHSTLKQCQFNVGSTSTRRINVDLTLFQLCVAAGLVWLSLFMTSTESAKLQYCARLLAPAFFFLYVFTMHGKHGDDKVKWRNGEAGCGGEGKGRSSISSVSALSLCTFPLTLYYFFISRPLVHLSLSPFFWETSQMKGDTVINTFMPSVHNTGTGNQCRPRSNAA